MKIFGDINSGHCLKVKLVSDYLGLHCSWVEVDTMRGESRMPECLRLNPCAQVPAVEDSRTLAQSNAIIRHLAREHLLDLVPAASKTAGPS